MTTSHVTTFISLNHTFTCSSFFSFDNICITGQPEKIHANGCFIVEGRTTLAIRGGSVDNNEDIELGAYHKIREFFAAIPYALKETIIVDIRYISNMLPMTTPATTATTAATTTATTSAETATVPAAATTATSATEEVPHAHLLI